ncbi:MAG: putative aminohydrolase SsnA [bacterium]
MDEYLIANGTVVTLGDSNEVIENGAVYVKDGKIEDVGKTSKLKDKYDCPVGVDAQNKVVMPGFICAHHHLYSTMARGFAPPGEPAYTFEEILERLWWKLDKALTRDDVYYSALIPLIECIRNGTTTLLDHHASPNCHEGSLKVISDAVKESGLRASLCYEVSDRNEKGEGIEENERFLKQLENEDPSRLHGMVGIHASFTVCDETLDRCSKLAEKYNTGCHIHVAEGIEDVEDALENHGVRTIERLVDHNIAGDKSLFIHCINIDENEMQLLKDTGTIAIHNPESNMNNAVGVAPILDMMENGILVGLGTDGMSSDMPAQMRCAYLLHRLDREDPRVGFMEAPEMLLNNNATIANRLFPVKLGELTKGAAADIAILDYIPPTLLDGNTFLGHFIFGMVDATVDTTIAGGKVLMKNKELKVLDEEKIAAKSRELSQQLWKRIS